MDPVALAEPTLEERLDTADRRRLRAARAKLRVLGAQVDSFTEAALTLRELTGTDRAAVYTRSDDGDLGTIGHTFDETNWVGRVRACLPRAAVYRLNGADDFGNTAVTDETLYRDSGPNVIAQKHEAFREFGYTRQLRVALYQRERFHLYLGVFNVNERDTFAERQAIMLAAAARTYGRSRRLAERFATTPLASLSVVLDRCDQPVVVFDRQHRLVHVNRAGAVNDAHHATWLKDMLRNPDAAQLGRYGDLIELEGYNVVIGHVAPASESERLPESLRTVAMLAIAGKTDKEIALELGRPIATVRTYMQRIYARLGVHSRVELASKLR